MKIMDISGCEIRTISYKSGDPFMIDCYNKHKDPYITMASYAFPEHKDDIKYLKSWRSVFKQVLLGCLYGMGSEKLAELIEMPVDRCEEIINALWDRCPILKQFVEQKSQWSMDHLGYVESALGDILEMGEDDGEDRAARLGINQYIQNYSSVSLADGFENILNHSIHHIDEKIPDVMVRPIGVIHDSCQFLFTTPYLFRMKDYYVRHLTEYMYNIHKIYYTFDLELGVNFYDICDLNQIDEHHIEFTGNYISIRAMVDKCVADGLKFRVTSLKDSDGNEISVNGFEFGPEFKSSRYTSIIHEFMDYELYAKFNEDLSKYKIMFEELPGNPGWTWTDEELESIGLKEKAVKVEEPTTWKPPF